MNSCNTLERYFLALMKKSYPQRMEDGEGPTLEEWIKMEYDSSK